jgi:hypothetical protein
MVFYAVALMQSEEERLFPSHPADPAEGYVELPTETRDSRPNLVQRSRRHH